ncbi:specifically androgen-regulated gene protein-like [Stegostoma tigrinum]|uniref:specifically androgen-regulated gene protein-like n=1 Tax=Stegostoma tigrinum TaxID=3053191 RepID=UPI00202B179B|nr:specifically androgen-regulated gene protein-like [Stegostoma tigrinum]XP_048409514.1 specifically androgen-regulated gene protein-like [Stegostoma tigrinum]
MPTGDTWIGQFPMDSMPSVSFVGSCNNVMSTNSAFSDEYLDYLSAEERECLMFLEETIDALDIEDNGVSTEELEQTEHSSRTANTLERPTLSHPELGDRQITEPDGKIPREVSANKSNSTEFISPKVVQENSGAHKFPRAVSPHSNKNCTDSTSSQMVRAKTGANTLPKYTQKPSAESKSMVSNQISESSRNPILSEDTRRRSNSAIVQHELVETKEEKTKLGPPTAPKPRKLPSNIILKSFQKNDNPMVPNTNSQSSFKVPKGASRNNGYNLSRDNSTDEEVKQARMQALSKLGLLSEPDGQKNSSASPPSLKTEGTSISQTVTASNETKRSQPKMPARNTNSLKRPTGIGPPLIHSAVAAVDPGMNGNANKMSSVTVGNANKVQWQLSSMNSSNLKRFTASGNAPPTMSLGPTRNSMPTTTALNPGMSNTLPIARRPANASEGEVKNINAAQWQFGATKASSLKRFGTASDNNQPSLYSGVAQTTSMGAASTFAENTSSRPRPVSICSEKDLSVKHGSTLEVVSSTKPGRKSFPITINHISAKFQRSPPKALNVQVAPLGPTSKDHREALRKLGLLKE